MYRYFLPYTVLRGNNGKIELKFIQVIVVSFICYNNVISVRNALEIAVNTVQGGYVSLVPSLEQQSCVYYYNIYILYYTVAASISAVNYYYVLLLLL